MTLLRSTLCFLIVGFHLTMAQLPTMPALVCNDPLLPAGDASCLVSCGPTATSATCVSQGVCVCQYAACTAADVVSPTLCPASGAGPFGPVLPQLEAFCVTECQQNVCATGTGVICNTNDAAFGTSSWICNCQCPPVPCPVTTTASPLPLIAAAAAAVGITKVTAFASIKWGAFFALVNGGLAALIVGTWIVALILKALGIVAAIIVLFQDFLT